MYNLTDDQYDTFYVAAHNLCGTANSTHPVQGYPHMDQLANYTTMLTGKYPEPEVILKAWETAKKTSRQMKKEEAEMIMEAFIGPFTYNKNRTTKPWYDVLTEELRELLKTKEVIKEILEEEKNNETRT